MSENHIDAGRRGESAALDHLLKAGYRLLERNFRSGRGEIDLIVEAPDGDLVFVEVKASRQDEAGDPLERVTARKQRQIQRIAQLYCLEHHVPDRAMRFDVIGVDLRASGPAGSSESEPGPALRHIPHAFLPALSGYLR